MVTYLTKFFCSVTLTRDSLMSLQTVICYAKKKVLTRLKKKAGFTNAFKSGVISSFNLFQRELLVSMIHGPESFEKLLAHWSWLSHVQSSNIEENGFANRVWVLFQTYNFHENVLETRLFPGKGDGTFRH